MSGCKTYIAEHEFWTSCRRLAYWRKPFDSLAEADAMAFDARDSRRLVPAHRNGRCLRVTRKAADAVGRESRGGGVYYASRHEIRLASASFRWVLLHELAHAAVIERGHGSEFRCAYVSIVRDYIDDKAADLLLDTFRQHHLR